MPRTVLFYRTFKRFTGGHLKVWDYFNHVRAAHGYEPRIRFSNKSVWNEENPWTGADGVLRSGDHVVPDVLFVEGGRDWVAADADGTTSLPSRPIINLVQNVKHADPGNPRYELLSRKAVRICVSEEVTDAVRSTGRPHGPVLTIPVGIDVAEVRSHADPREDQCDVLVLATNRTELGRRLAAHLGEASRVRLVDARVPRHRLLAWMSVSRVSVLLPSRREGFFLPPLEAMALGSLVVLPDCPGTSAYLPGKTCLRPADGEVAIRAAAKAALSLEPGERNAILSRATLMVESHDLARERGQFLSLLERVEDLWGGA